MVGLRFLAPSIGVRIPVSQRVQKKQAFACFFCTHDDTGMRKAQRCELANQRAGVESA